MRETPDEATTEARVTPRQEIMREVNLSIFEIGSRLAGQEPYTFFCECNDPHCDRTIKIHLHRFDPAMSAGSLLAHVPDLEQESLI